MIFCSVQRVIISLPPFLVTRADGPLPLPNLTWDSCQVRKDLTPTLSPTRQSFTGIIMKIKMCILAFLLLSEYDFAYEFLQRDIFVLPLSMRGSHACDRQWFDMIRPFSVWVTSAAVSFRTLPSGAPTVLSVCA